MSKASILNGGNLERACRFKPGVEAFLLVVTPSILRIRAPGPFCWPWPLALGLCATARTSVRVRLTCAARRIECLSITAASHYTSPIR